MGRVTYRDGVAILQVIIYFPALFCAILLCIRHGFSKSSGWVLLVTFSALRIAGAVAQLVTINSPGNINAIITALICDSIGLSPLTLLSLGLLARLNRFVRRPVNPQLFRLVSLVALAGLILGIYGGVHAADNATSFNININWYSKSAVIIFGVVFIIAVVLFILLARQVGQVERGERRLVIAVGLSIPFIAVRLVYAFIADFSNNGAFNVYFGSTTVYLCMAVLEEIFVVIICIGVGFTLKRLPRDDDAARREVLVPGELERGTVGDGRNTTAYGYKEGETNAQAMPTGQTMRVQDGGMPQRRRRRKLGYGPIHIIINLTLNAIDDWKEKRAMRQGAGRV